MRLLDEARMLGAGEGEPLGREVIDFFHKSGFIN